MNKFGLVGGLGYESTIDYYKSILDQVYSARGNYPEVVIYSVDIKTMLGFMEAGDMPGLAGYLSAAVNSLKAAGCVMAGVASNTPHVAIDLVRKLSGIPLISIVDETVEECRRLDCKRIGVIGTGFTVRSGLYAGPLKAAGIEAFSLDEAGITWMSDKIFSELEYGIVKPETRDGFVKRTAEMTAEHGLDALILGCTELPMILKPEDFPGVKSVNTTEVHVGSIVRFILSGAA